MTGAKMAAAATGPAAAGVTFNCTPEQLATAAFQQTLATLASSGIAVSITMMNSGGAQPPVSGIVSHQELQNVKPADAKVAKVAKVAKYSQTGSGLARAGYQAYQQAVERNCSFDDAKKFIQTALSSIVSSVETTLDEKTVAKLGLEAGNVRTNSVICGAIAKAVARPLGAVFGGILEEAIQMEASNSIRVSAILGDDSNKAPTHEYCARLADSVFEAIGWSSNTSDLDKELASMGQNMRNPEWKTWEMSAAVCRTVAQGLARPPQGGAGTVLAAVGREAYLETQRLVDARRQTKQPAAADVAGEALRAVMKNPRSSDVQKAIARSALNDTSGYLANFDESCGQIRGQALEMAAQNPQSWGGGDQAWGGPIVAKESTPRPRSSSRVSGGEAGSSHPKVSGGEAGHTRPRWHE